MAFGHVRVRFDRAMQIECTPEIPPPILDLSFDGTLVDAASGRSAAVDPGTETYDASRRAFVFDGQTRVTHHIAGATLLPYFTGQDEGTLLVRLAISNPMETQTILAFGGQGRSVQSNRWILGVHLGRMKVTTERGAGVLETYDVGPAPAANTWSSFAITLRGEVLESFAPRFQARTPYLASETFARGLVIGGALVPGSGYFRGAIERVQFYPVPLTPARARRLTAWP